MKTAIGLILLLGSSLQIANPTPATPTTESANYHVIITVSGSGGVLEGYTV